MDSLAVDFVIYCYCFALTSNGRPSQILIERLTCMLPASIATYSPAYSTWLGKPVVLLVVIRQCQVPVPCLIVGESVGEVRVRIHPGWEMDVRKELILAVEEDAVTTNAHVN